VASNRPYALVDHTKLAQKLIDLEYSSEGGEASYLELRKLSVEWERRNIKWREKQQKRAKPPRPTPPAAPA
jgi:hypothetical protein